MEKKLWVYFIGIAGVATGQLAVEYKRNGWIVTGSDRGLFPPMSTYLKENGIDIQIGYKKEHLEDKKLKSHPDLIINGGSKGEKNEEFLYAQELGLTIKYYPEIIATDVVVDGSSIVIAGSYAKSTITSMLVKIFEKANKEISYMYGALNADGSNGLKFKNKNTQYSIVEGDEYIVSRERPISKFFMYTPKYLVITSLKWDHTDVFKTRDEYIDNYINLIKKIPHDGIVFYPEEDTYLKKILSNVDCTIIGVKTRNFKISILGEHNQLNASVAYEVSKTLEISEADINSALSEYKGIKRRLEIRLKTEKYIIIDDFGASAPKAKISIDSIKKEYPKSKIIGIFEPNLGSRTKESMNEYDHVFDKLDELILPRFTHVRGEYISNLDLAEFVSKDIKNVKCISKDIDVLEEVKLQSDGKEIVVLFIGSHGFRGIIENMVLKLKDNN